MQRAEKRLLVILRRAQAVGIPPEAIVPQSSNSSPSGSLKKLKKITCILTPIIILLWAFGKYLVQGNSKCLIEMPFDPTKVFRKPEDCAMCRHVNQVDRVSNVSHLEFEERYATTARPLIVTDGTRDWSQTDVFSFEFFRKLYEEHPRGKTECQFFPYKTEFRSLREALHMPANRSRLEPGTPNWYIGWSNCNDAAGEVLRQHYKRPYFLPETSENMALSWIFMGGPGDGAHMHVDNVRYASWQAQLRGKKKWRLAPPPECYYVCTEFEAIVQPGEIIVVDTNRWYHQTHILPGDISITIGTEFD